MELAFDRMVRGWFAPANARYGQFERTILEGDTRVATRRLSDVARACASSFDSGDRGLPMQMSPRAAGAVATDESALVVANRAVASPPRQLPVSRRDGAHGSRRRPDESPCQPMRPIWLPTSRQIRFVRLSYR